MLDSVTINQLRTFVAVCEEGSFSGAAKKLMRAQSAVSHAISALEQALDVALFERDARRAELSAAGRNLLPDARSVIARTEEMKTRASAIARFGAPQLSIAADVYFPRPHLIACLQSLQTLSPMVAVSLRMTTMQGGEALVLDGVCSMAISIADVPELNPDAIERHWLGETSMVTVCAPTHPLAAARSPVPTDEFSRHVQLVVTDNRPNADKTEVAVVGERKWHVNDLSAKHDFLTAGLGWGHMPRDLVTGDLAAGTLVAIQRHAWHIRPLTFMLSQRRGQRLQDAEATLRDLLADWEMEQDPENPIT
ncbi:LysR family transcriptional regulator [Mesorhizobium huakuii]|uniref:LysR family transcriptional regulator n=1 Tax=Mesorhizobium huakuii TaxID=28104 RepID=A0ABZ0VWQ7_9HYPH|nr:LysR family transcriptional regulator [Mesorhizobium huakuii]WQC01112.1 LysR family transcriptional regulator [Mesorhizobium huakuii]